MNKKDKLKKEEKMVINEKGFLRAMKEAYKGTGYQVACKESGDGLELYIKTGMWRVNCELKNFPRKALGLLVEHMGTLPEPGQALQVKKKECQTMIFNDAMEAFQGITPDDCINPANVVKTDLTYKGGSIWSQPRGKRIYWIDPDLEDIIKLTGKEYSLGNRVISANGTVSAVAIVPTEPANLTEKRVLEYLAGLNGYESA